MEKIRNLSIRKTILLYMTVSLCISFIAGTVIILAAERTQEQIWRKYIDEERYQEAVNAEEGNYTALIPRVSADEMTRIDAFMSETCDFLQTYSILFLSFFGSIWAVLLFYRDKLKIPLEELSSASKMIADDQLDFRVEYSNQDEMGRLCMEFERMRDELEKNSRKMWRMVEEEKALRAAIAHDIRTPLAILRGYQEMLLEFAAEDMLSKEKMMEMLREGMTQIERIHDFMESMRKLSSLESREIRYQEVTLGELKEEIEKSGTMFAEDAGKELRIYPDGSRQSGERFLADLEMVLEVSENILSNAFRYAKKRVDVEISVDDIELTVEVRDDGTGFKEDADLVTKAYYHSNPNDDLKHSGMGMYISKVYCEKHGGCLLLGNQRQGGAVVRAVFKIVE